MRPFVCYLLAVGIVVFSRQYAFGDVVLTSNYGSTFYTLNESSATATEIPQQFLTPFFSTSDFGSQNQLYGLQGSTLYRVDFEFALNTYTYQKLRDLSSGSDSIAMAPGGHLYVYNSSSNGRIGRVDISTGVETSVPLSQVNGRRVFFQGIDFSPNGELYGVDSNALYRIDPVTGAVTRITPTGVNAIPRTIFTELDYSAEGILRAITFSNTVWQIDPITGMGINPVEYDETTFSSIATTAVPEPTSCCLLAGGLLTIIGRRYRKSLRKKLQPNLTPETA